MAHPAADPIPAPAEARPGSSPDSRHDARLASGARGDSAARLAGLQVLRGAAALLVVFHHYVGTSVERGFAIRGLEDVALGNAGTDIFFIISGFIMEYLRGSQPYRPGERARFLQRRAARILPLYWALTLVAFGIAMLLPQLVNSTTSWRQLGLSMLLLPDGAVGAYLIPLAWTLSFEMLFYLLFAALLPLRPWTRIAALALLFLPSLFVPAAFTEQRPIVGMLLHPLLFEFLAGVILARLALARQGPGLLLRCVLVLCGAALLLADASVEVTESLPRLWTWGVPALLMVAGVVLGARPQTPRNTAPPLRAAAWLGDISYSLYLSHFFALALFAKLYFRFGLDLRLPPWLVAVAVLATCLLVAQACYLLVERPARRALAGAGHASKRLAPAT